MHNKYERLTTNSLGDNRRGLLISKRGTANKTPVIDTTPVTDNNPVIDVTSQNDSCLNIDLVVPQQRAFQIDDETPNMSDMDMTPDNSTIPLENRYNPDQSP